MASTRRQFVLSAAALAKPALARNPAPALPNARPSKKLLSGPYSPEKLAAVLLPRESWKPFPRAADREGWNFVPDHARKSLIEAGARDLGAEWPSVTATLFLEYVRTGSRSNYDRLVGRRYGRAGEMVIAECMEGKGRFLDEILNGLWLICEQTYWGLPAHLDLQKAGFGLPDAAEPTIDLWAGDVASTVAWADYFLGPELEKISPLVRKRLRMEIDRRILTPNLERNDFWWMGLDPRNPTVVNNWNPWINSNVLTCALLMEHDPRRRAASVHKVLRTLDRFLDSYHDDGGCDEGPSYWFSAGGALFDCFELLHSASGGAMDFYSLPLVKEIGRYIYRAHISGKYFVNFADCSPELYVAGDMVYAFGKRIADKKMQALGALAAVQQFAGGVQPDSVHRLWPTLARFDEIRNAEKYEPLERDVWLPGIQVMAARRRERSAEGLYIAAQGGHNDESHNHNDVGNFIVYADGQPAIIDVGPGEYTSKTFSPQRYEIWTMQSAFHNTPTIGGVMQSAGREFAASEAAHRADERAAEFSLDISKAYPAEAGLRHWKRTFRLDRDANRIEVRDNYALAKAGSRITLSLMTACKVAERGPGELTLAAAGFRSGPVRIEYDGTALAAQVEEIKLDDEHLKNVWGAVYRILLVCEKAPLTATWTLRISQSGA